MSSISGSSPTLSTNASSSALVDQLVQAYVQSISTPVYDMQNQVSQVDSTISVYQKLKSALSDLQTQASNLAQVGTLSPLAAETVTSSNSSVVTATAQPTATAGTHTVFVSQLAKNDTLVSNELTQSGTDISTATGAGTFTFSITVNGKATNVSVNVSAGDTNSTVLSNIASAVNSAGAGVTASVVNDTSSTARLVFQSTDTGSANAISVADTSGALLQNVGWTSSVISSRTASTSTGAGYINSSTSALDANFTLDGISIVSGSNTVSNVLTGVTFNLAAAQLSTDAPVNLAVGPDTTSVQSALSTFISKFNTVITTLSADTTDTSSTDSSGNTTVTRAPLAGDVTATNLQLSLENIAMGVVSSAQSGEPNTLSAIGIKLNNDGTLSISDQSTLNSALQSNPGAVVALFNSSSGVATQLNTLLQEFTNPGGVMDQMVNGAQDQVTQLNNMINSMQQS
ncbi:MAG: flagellar filament capping protein FliD, partial [Bacteroidetes bacterium]|nr:flagellar filament capping protein FliD [Bacteroidota bacterium]